MIKMANFMLLFFITIKKRKTNGVMSENIGARLKDFSLVKTGTN